MKVKLKEMYTFFALESMFDRQKKFQEKYIIKKELGGWKKNKQNLSFVKALKSKLSYKEKVKWTKEFVLDLESELHELLRETKFKHWSKKQKRGKRTSIIEEIIDSMHFLINICLIWEITPTEFFREFKRKNDVNIKRQELGY